MARRYLMTNLILSLRMPDRPVMKKRKVLPKVAVSKS